MKSRPDRARVLLTGAKGKIASGVAPQLREVCELFETDILPPKGDEANYRMADLLEFEQIVPLMEGMDAVVHMAIATVDGFSQPNGTLEYEEMALKVNVTGCYHAYEAARRAGVKKFIYMSSLTTIMGGWTSQQDEEWAQYHYDEHTLPNPQNQYACTKLYGENMGSLYSRLHGMSVICLRIGQPYPIGNYLDGRWPVNRKSRGLVIAMEDIGRAILCGLNTQIPFGVYNLVSHSDTQVVSLARAREIGFVTRAYFSDAGLAFQDAPPKSPDVSPENPSTAAQ